jgi:hypothetical protein
VTCNSGSDSVAGVSPSWVQKTTGLNPIILFCLFLSCVPLSLTSAQRGESWLSPRGPDSTCKQGEYHLVCPAHQYGVLLRACTLYWPASVVLTACSGQL